MQMTGEMKCPHHLTLVRVHCWASAGVRQSGANDRLAVQDAAPHWWSHRSARQGSVPVGKWFSNSASVVLAADFDA